MMQTEGALLMSANFSAWLEAASEPLRKWLIRRETCCADDESHSNILLDKHY